jgi:asparagine synthase (glutamine-hydrolysing)
MILGLRERLLQAVKVRLHADVPVGIYLSGGIDSAIIAGMVAHLTKQEKAINGDSVTKPITCFGIGFEGGDEFDETCEHRCLSIINASLVAHWPLTQPLSIAIARRTAESLGLPFVTKRMTEESLTSKFEDATYHAEHHNPDLNYIAKFALSELPQEHGYKVILSGKSGQARHVRNGSERRLLTKDNRRRI